MIEKVVLDYLNEVLEVRAYMEVPVDPPERYVVIEKVGGGVENYIRRAALALQSYAESLYQAAVLNEAVKAAMDDIVALDSVSHASLSNDYNFTDTRTKKYRYQAVYNIVY